MAKKSHMTKLSADARILIVLLRAKRPYTYKELAKKAGVHRSTVHRVIPLLVDRGIAEKCPQSMYLRRNYQVKKRCVKLSAKLVMEELPIWLLRETLRVREHLEREAILKEEILQKN